MRSVFQTIMTAFERKLNCSAEGVAFHLFSFSHCVLISFDHFHKRKSSNDLRQYVQSILVTLVIDTDCIASSVGLVANSSGTTKRRV